MSRFVLEGVGGLVYSHKVDKRELSILLPDLGTVLDTFGLKLITISPFPIGKVYVLNIVIFLVYSSQSIVWYVREDRAPCSVGST